MINANRIFGPNLTGVRGPTVRRPLESVTTNHIQIPRALLERHQRVTLAVDVMFVNGVPFLVSVSRGLNLVTAEYTPSCTAKQLAVGIRRVMNLYSHGGFHLGMILMDNEFKKLRNLVPILIMNTKTAKEHVPEVEQQIRLIKKRGRGVLNTLLFKKMPQVILIKLIYHVVLWLKAFPTKTGMSAMLSLCEILYRHKLDFAKHCKAQFGMYCEAHNEPVRTNMMVTRLAPAIVLGPSGNLQGTYKFFSLATGKKIKQRKMTAYPMPNLVTKKVEQFGKANTTPNVFNFSDRNEVLFEWNNKVNKYPEGIVQEEVVLYPALTAKILGMVLDQDQPIPLIEGKIEPQGHAKDNAAGNANIEPFDITGVDAPTIVLANNDKINKIDDNNNNIMSIATIPPANDPNPLVLPDTSGNDDAGANNNKSSNDDESNDDESSNNGNPETQGEIVADEPAEDPTESEDQGVRQSKHKNKGRTSKDKDYGLMMNKQRKVKGGKRRTTICDGFMFFSAEDLSDAKPVAKEDREEWALGVALSHYSMGVGIKKFWRGAKQE
jgi:hypothetical protein